MDGRIFPVSGGFVLTCNHVSSFDPWPLGLPLWPKRWLRFMAKSELYSSPARWILDSAGAFKVHRGLADVEAIETAVQLARDGHTVMMFPEGTRRTKGLVKKHEARPRTGAARIALRLTRTWFQHPLGRGTPSLHQRFSGSDGAVQKRVRRRRA